MIALRATKTATISALVAELSPLVARSFGIRPRVKRLVGNIGIPDILTEAHSLSSYCISSRIFLFSLPVTFRRSRAGLPKPAHGTKRPCRAGLAMSVVRGRPEAVGGG